MKDEEKIRIIGKAIREGRYLNITYNNIKGIKSSFWICVLDINEKGELIVNEFNPIKGKPVKNAKIYISKIQTIEILKFSKYNVSERLIKRLDTDESLSKFNFGRYDNRILNYYLECYKANQDPFLHRKHLIGNIDINTLTRESPYKLSAEQKKDIISEIYHNEYKRYYDYELAMCEFSIDIESNKKFVVSYRKLRFDPVAGTLELSKEVYFNSTFYIDGIKFSLPFYTNISPADFESLYLEDRNSAINVVFTNCQANELVNTRPEIVVLGYEQIDISKVYDQINSQHIKGEMEIPLKAFFQNSSLLDRINRREPNVVLFDSNVNVDQVRTIYNTLKYPITYVQGPPGTGKTQTILNIVVNCLTNNKTLLITSNNNIPLDGIVDKLYLGKYNNKEILFPIMRLGNNKYTLKAIHKIRELYNFETKDIPKENMLVNLKEQSRENNKRVLQILSSYEVRCDLEQNLDAINKILSQGTGKSELLEIERKKLQKKLDEIPELNNKSLDGTFQVIKNNHKMLQYFYYESLRCIKKLKGKEYVELVDILRLDNEDDQLSAFNKWIANDINIEKLNKVFPVIVTTNISSRKLGSQYKFDILAIDEAGQCDIATSLIPISKCRNMVLIGDQNQLKPIILIDKKYSQRLLERFGLNRNYDYYDNSILSVFMGIDNISRNILLRYHYRCGKRIINFSNMRFYENKLNLDNIVNEGEVKLVQVSNVTEKGRNSYLEEAQAVLDYIRDNKLTDVFVLTPFRNQEEVLSYYLKQAQKNGEIDDSVKCGTIHKVQGQENRTIILSTAISKRTSPKTYDWIKNNSQLINVGVTRAKENLIIVTDTKAIDILSNKSDDLYSLIDYVRKNGNSKVLSSNVNKLTIGFSNNSRFEDEFYTTMSHYCSVNGGKFKRNVKVTELFPDQKTNKLMANKEFDGVIYVNDKPQVVFEVNGGEHYTDLKTIKSDKEKIEFLHSQEVKLIFIPNQYVKHYQYIREVINKINGQGYQVALFEDYENGI